jgi:(p)ppGpp synthase/HD superfamily hydrolase
MSTVTTINDVLKSATLRSVEQQRIRAASAYASKIYGDRQHWSGLTLMEHSFGVLQHLLPFHPDTDTVVACLLQHALETRSVHTHELQEEFGPSVRSIVSAVHLLSHVSKRTRSASVDDLRVMLLSVSSDIRVLLVLLCERSFIAERLSLLPLQERRVIGRGILDLFAPVAARLGIHTLKQSLESLAFPVVYPSDAERIEEQLADLKRQHAHFLDDAATKLRASLLQQGVTAVVQGREKQAYSIFSKLRAKGSTRLEHLHDLFALRVIVDREDDCYRALGVLHRIGHPLTNRFKDYIAFPKPITTIGLREY